MKWKTIVWRAAPLLIIILGVAYAADGWKAFPEAVVAWGTILLAFATFRLGQVSREENDRLIQQNERLMSQNQQIQHARIQMEAYGRRLNEVEQWATKCIRYITLIKVTNLDMQRYEALAELDVLNSTSKSIINVASSIDQKLADLVTVASTKFEKYTPIERDPGVLQELDQYSHDILSFVINLKCEMKL